MKEKKKNFGARIVGCLCLCIMLLAWTACDSEDGPSMNQTIWVHSFAPGEQVADGVTGAALVFSGGNVLGYYAIDEQRETLELMDMYSYRWKDGALWINEKAPLKVRENRLVFEGLEYIRLEQPNHSFIYHAVYGKKEPS